MATGRQASLTFCLFAALLLRHCVDAHSLKYFGPVRHRYRCRLRQKHLEQHQLPRRRTSRGSPSQAPRAAPIARHPSEGHRTAKDRLRPNLQTCALYVWILPDAGLTSGNTLHTRGKVLPPIVGKYCHCRSVFQIHPVTLLSASQVTSPGGKADRPALGRRCLRMHQLTDHREMAPKARSLLRTEESIATPCSVNT